MTAPAPTSQDGFTPPRSPLGEVWAIAWPTVLTMTSYTVMQFIDKLMVAQVGALEVAAQGNGGIWTFTPMAFGLGVLTVINTYVSQNLGAGQPEKGPRVRLGGRVAEHRHVGADPAADGGSLAAGVQLDGSLR